LGRKLDVYECFARAYESMGSEGVPAAIEYLRTVVHYRVPELRPPYQVRLGDALWKAGDRYEAAREYREALAQNPKITDADRLRVRISEAEKAVPVQPDSEGTLVREPWPAPIECANPSKQRAYRWITGGVSQTLCAVINEYGREDGFLFPRDGFGKEANFTIQIEGAGKGEPYKKDDLPVTVYHHNGNSWRRVLLTRAHSFTFIPGKKSGVPDIAVTWDNRNAAVDFDESVKDSRDHRTVYTWNGSKYRNRELDKAQVLNAQALARFQKGDKNGAIEVWQKSIMLARVPGTALTSEAEIMNNLGFACISADCDAEKYLGFALKINPYRWQAHLNLGDYYWDKGQKEKGIEYYARVVSYNPGYRNTAKLLERIETTQHAVAMLHEVPVAPFERYSGSEVTSRISPYAERYAQAQGLDTDRLVRILGLNDGQAPKVVSSIIIVPGKDQYFTSSTVRIFELLRAKMRDRAEDVYFILYNVHRIPNWDEDQIEYARGWRLAEMNPDYSLNAVHDLFKSTKCDWPDYFTKITNMYVEAGELKLDVLNSESGRYAFGPGGSEYTFVPDKKKMVLKAVTCRVSEQRDDEE
jgi:tetratricopeptide (TPR) repeat protein